MKAFADLYTELDETTKTSEKVDALARYFSHASAADAAWAVYFLIGRKPRQVVPSKLIRTWAIEEGGISEWLFAESYDAVGDIAETIALLLPSPAQSSDLPLHQWVERLLAMRNAGETAQHDALVGAWREMDQTQRFVWNKLISGAFRVGVSQQLVIRALARVSGVDTGVVAHRLMGDWEPTPTFFEQLCAIETKDADISQLYPFCLAHALEGTPDELGDVTEWQVEWKWDGIRAQLIRREGQSFLWTRGEELVTERYPEIMTVAEMLPDGTVIDGELLPWKEGAPLPFAQMQKRIGRKSLSRKILSEVPVVLVAFDLLEHDGRDIRQTELRRRRNLLEELVAITAQPGRLTVSPIVRGASWEELIEARATSREHHAEGLMLKRLSSPYRVGRQRGDWWKWKIHPFTVDAVLTAAQPGSGKRASLFTDYTFAVWDEGRLVTIAKAYSGLTDEEIRQVDSFVRKNTLEKFGPVRMVKPELVFELAFEGIQRSTRHKAGIAVRFPRISRWRHDKKADEADTLAMMKGMLAEETTGAGGP
jgi:DNA ligase-1